MLGYSVIQCDMRMAAHRRLSEIKGRLKESENKNDVVKFEYMYVGYLMACQDLEIFSDDEVGEMTEWIHLFADMKDRELRLKEQMRKYENE